jgi:translation initiation factor 2B subunit (eIF-2B alpha/beta/delta family)
LEETTLNEDDISLLRRGKPFSLVDEKLKTKWTIHPFAWQLKPNAKPIKLDWEHTEYRFVKPEDLGKYEHVPQLEVGMNRVLVSHETERALKVLRDDHESGAQALAVKALRILMGFVKGDEMGKLATSEELWRETKWRAWHLAKNGRPSMGSAIEAELFRVLDSAGKQLEGNGAVGLSALSVDAIKSAVVSAIEARIEARENTLNKLASSFVELVERISRQEVEDDSAASPSAHIVTLSSSGTIGQCFKVLISAFAEKRMLLKLSVLESRPNFEGVSFINALLKSYENKPNLLEGVTIEIISDASVGSAVKDADFVVFGGDKVLSNGNVSNKMGSLAAAVIAETLNPHCTVLAVFETTKVAASGCDAEHLKVEFNNAAELTSVWPSHYVKDLEANQAKGFQVQVKNAYFEWVPADYIDLYITEEGVMERSSIEKLAEDSKELEERVFGDL